MSATTDTKKTTKIDKDGSSGTEGLGVAFDVDVGEGDGKISILESGIA
jgi:hypothetical protein